MIEKINSTIEVKEEKNIKNTFLYIRNVNINLESYETKILSEDNIENIIKFQIAYEEEKRLLKYDVSGTMSLEEYISSKKLDKKDICDLMIAIDDVLSSTENYLISEGSISLDLRLIRVLRKNANNVIFKFIAIPNYNSNFSYELSKFLIRILRHVDVSDKDALSLGYSLFVRSSKENYTINDLMELIDVEKSKNELCDMYSLEELAKYDEKIANEIDDSLLECEDVDKYIASPDSLYEDEKVEEIDIDNNTKAVISNSLFDEFDNDKKKILKFDNNKKIKVKTLSGHIIVSPFFYLFLPIIFVLTICISYFLLDINTFLRIVPVTSLIVLIIAMAFMALKLFKARNN